MARELEGLREQASFIREKTGKDFLTVRDVCEYLGRSRHYVKDKIMPNANNICSVELARTLLLISRGETIKKRR